MASKQAEPSRVAPKQYTEGYSAHEKATFAQRFADRYHPDGSDKNPAYGTVQPLERLGVVTKSVRPKTCTAKEATQPQPQRRSALAQFFAERYDQDGNLKRTPHDMVRDAQQRLKDHLRVMSSPPPAISTPYDLVRDAQQRLRDLPLAKDSKRPTPCPVNGPYDGRVDGLLAETPLEYLSEHWLFRDPRNQSQDPLQMETQDNVLKAVNDEEETISLFGRNASARRPSQLEGRPESSPFDWDRVARMRRALPRLETDVPSTCQLDAPSTQLDDEAESSSDETLPDDFPARFDYGLPSSSQYHHGDRLAWLRQTLPRLDTAVPSTYQLDPPSTSSLCTDRSPVNEHVGDAPARPQSCPVKTQLDDEAESSFGETAPYDRPARFGYGLPPSLHNAGDRVTALRRMLPRLDTAVPSTYQLDPPLISSLYTDRSPTNENAVQHDLAQPFSYPYGPSHGSNIEDPASLAEFLRPTHSDLRFSNPEAYETMLDERGRPTPFWVCPPDQEGLLEEPERYVVSPLTTEEFWGEEVEVDDEEVVNRTKINVDEEDVAEEDKSEENEEVVVRMAETRLGGDGEKGQRSPCPLGGEDWEVIEAE